MIEKYQQRITRESRSASDRRMRSLPLWFGIPPPLRETAQMVLKAFFFFSASNWEVALFFKSPVMV